MHGFLRHEFQKSRGRFLIATICFTALLCCYFFCMGKYLSTIDFPSNRQDTYSAKADQLRTDGDSYLHGSDLSQGKAKKIEENFDTQEKLLEGMVSSSRKGDWKAELRSAVEQEKLEQAIESKGIFSPNQYLSQKLTQNEYFLSHGIRPKDSDSACDGLNVLVMISQRFLPALMVLCVLLLILGTWFSEAKSGSLKLLLWQARPKWKIALDKILAAWVESTAVIAVSCLAAFLLCWALFGFGLPEYPVFLENGQVRLTTDVILQAVALLPAETLGLSVVSGIIAGGAVLKSK